MRKFSKTWTLMKASLEILKKDKEMLLFPLISGITLLIVSASFIVPLFISDNWISRFLPEDNGIVNYMLLFIFYFVTYFVIIFFNAALIGCAKIRIDGGDPTVLDGFRIAISHFFHIAVWTFISSSIGVVLQIIEDRFEYVGEIVSDFLGAAWSITSFFVIPILIIEGKKPSTALKDSAKLLKETWGEQAIGNFSFGFVFMALCFPALMIISLFALIVQGTISIAAIIAFIIYMIVLIIILSTLQGIFQTVLYQYVRFNKVSNGFDAELLISSIE